METGILTLVSVMVNALAAVFAPIVARRMAAQQERLQRAEDALNTLSAGLQVVERAVEENKDAISRSGAGDRIARTIRTYGPAARALVDAARVAARELRTNSVAAYEAQVIRNEQAERRLRTQGE